MARCWLSLGRQSHGWDGGQKSCCQGWKGRQDRPWNWHPGGNWQEGQSHGRWQARDSGRWAAFQIHPSTLAKVLLFLLDLITVAVGCFSFFWSVVFNCFLCFWWLAVCSVWAGSLTVEMVSKNPVAKVGKDDKTDPETDTKEGTDKKDKATEDDKQGTVAAGLLFKFTHQHWLRFCYSCWTWLL